jgi:hypothetical protein
MGRHRKQVEPRCDVAALVWVVVAAVLLDAAVRLLRPRAISR